MDIYPSRPAKFTYIGWWLGNCRQRMVSSQICEALRLTRVCEPARQRWPQANLAGDVASGKKIGGIKLRQLTQTLWLQYSQMVFVEPDQTIFAQLLEQPVEVHATHSCCVGQNLVCQRQIKRMIAHQIDTAKPCMQFAKEVRQMGGFLMSAHVGQPHS